MLNNIKQQFLNWCEEQDLQIPKEIGRFITKEDSAGTKFELSSINFATMNATYRPPTDEESENQP